MLALADRDCLSSTVGVADRQYWAWKLIDFPNATFQGGANGLACLCASGLIAPEGFRDSIIGRIAELFDGVLRITRRDGSLEEAFPYERSFCVTALVAYDLLRAHADLVSIERAKSAPLEAVAPLVRFLVQADETHGFISNHLATAVAALFRWHRETGDSAARRKGELLLDRSWHIRARRGGFPSTMEPIRAIRRCAPRIWPMLRIPPPRHGSSTGSAVRCSS